MFIGHYAVGLALKRQSPAIPLWLMFNTRNVPLFHDSGKVGMAFWSEQKAKDLHPESSM